MMIEFSEIQNIYYLLPLVGLVVGLFGTILGGSGGFFFLPVLILLGVPAQTAVTTSLVATLPISLVGSLGHYHKGNIDIKVAIKFAFAGIFGAFIGVAIISIITTDLLKISFGIYSMLVALNIAVDTRRKKLAENKGTKQQAFGNIKRISKSLFYGFFAGIITGTFGTSGTAPVLAGLFSLRLPLRLVIGTSLAVVLINTVFAIGLHILVAKINLTLICFLTVGSVIGAVIGPKFLSRINTGKLENKVRYLYAAVMVALGIIMIIS